jgi:hypothetical protein
MQFLVHNAQGSWKAFPSPMKKVHCPRQIIYLSLPHAALFWSFKEFFLANQAASRRKHHACTEISVTPDGYAVTFVELKP